MKKYFEISNEIVGILDYKTNQDNVKEIYFNSDLKLQQNSPIIIDKYYYYNDTDLNYFEIKDLFNSNVNHISKYNNFL